MTRTPVSLARFPLRRVALVLASAAALGALSGCTALVLGGAVAGTGLVFSDRRTTGTQVEDQAIELKAATRAKELATLGNINVTSYNRVLLVTGEVPGETEKKAVGDALAKVENVKTVFNELVVGPNSGVGSRSNDALLTSKVKATLIDAKDVQANAVKVVTEAGTVFLMGRVTEREAKRAAELSSSIRGVQRVVRVFEMMSEEELAALGRPAN